MQIAYAPRHTPHSIGIHVPIGGNRGSDEFGFLTFPQHVIVVTKRR